MKPKVTQKYVLKYKGPMHSQWHSCGTHNELTSKEEAFENKFIWLKQFPNDIVQIVLVTTTETQEVVE